MKIVHIVLGKANPERMNGVNKIVHQMACTQVREGKDVTILGLTDITQNGEDRPYNLKLVRQNPKSFLLGKAIRDFIDTLDKDTIAHFHGVLIPAFYSIAKILKRNRIPYIITPHGALQTMALRKSRWIKKPYIALFEKPFLRHAQAIQAITLNEQADILKLTNAQTIHIPNAYPDATTIPRTDKNTETIFGYIGRLDKNHKGLDVLIDAFAVFHRKHSQSCLWLIGDGKGRLWLEKKTAAYSLENKIIFHGEHHGDSKQKLLSKIDVFVHPSRWDVLPTAILEAAANGKPLIVTEATGFGPAIRQYGAGIMIPACEPEMLLDAMENIMAADHRAIGENAEKMVEQEYNWSKIVPRIISELYRL